MIAPLMQDLATTKEERPSDLALSRAVASGDTEAFDLLVGPHRDFFFRLARSRVIDGDAAEDVVQDALLVLLRQLRRGKEVYCVSTWVTGIIKRWCLRYQIDPVAGAQKQTYDSRRALRIDRMKPETSSAVATQPAALSDDPQAADREARMKLHDTLATARELLTKHERRIFFRWLQYVPQSTRNDGAVSWVDVAEDLGVTKPQVSAALRYAQWKLRDRAGVNPTPHEIVAEVAAWRSMHGLDWKTTARRLGTKRQTLLKWRQGFSQPTDPEALRRKMQETPHGAAEVTA
jgi:RNA polymerase sigma factor (sigma-70 family)